MNNMPMMEESFLQKQFEAKAAMAESRYGQYIEEASKTFNEMYQGKAVWSSYDTVGLGQYLESWESFSKMFEEDTTSRDALGDYLRVGMGLASLQYVTMPASFLASVQPMADEVGQVYFRELVATSSRGGVNKGDLIGTAEGKLDLSNLDNYYSESVTATPVAVSAGTKKYEVAASGPIRPRFVRVNVVIEGGANAGTYRGIDDGNSSIIGNWPVADGKQTGTIDYVGGDKSLVLNIDDTGATGGNIEVQYYQNLAQSDEMPGFQYRLTTKTVQAQYFILQNQYSTLADYTVRKRFGKSLSDDIATTAVQQINGSVLAAIIRKMKASAIKTGTARWDSDLTSNYVSVADHRRTFTDVFDEASQIIDNKTQRGAISFCIAGSYTRRILASLGVDLQRKPLPGPYLMGFFQNIPIYYAPQTLINDNEAIVGYRGTTWFEAPVIYGPFLPVVMVKGTAGSNVFNRITGIAHAAAVESVVDGFCARIEVQNFVK